LAATACGEVDGEAAPACQGAVTAIADIQGPGAVSPLVGTTVVVRGVVTRVEPGLGLYVENTGAAHDGRSRGLFIADGEMPTSLRSGQQIEVRGRVAELGGDPDPLTALVDATGPAVCAEATELPLTAARLPLDGADRESLEGMRIELDQPLVVADVYNMHRGEWTVSIAEPPRVPTEDAAPGGETAALEQVNRQRELGLVLPGPDLPAAPVGSAVGPLPGVLGNRDGRQHFFPESVPAIEVTIPPSVEPPAAGHLRIVTSNLLNYFNGDGRGSGFPTERGAETLTEFHAQQARTEAALARLQPHLLAVQELENDGFGTNSAAQSLLDLLNRTGAADWAVVDPGTGPIGGDVITVGLFYRTGILQAEGPPRVFEGPAFAGLSRQPLAQVFRERASGATLLVAVNHLKSKGRCPGEDARSDPNNDQGDGQGCWNRARVAAVESLLPWLEGLAREADTDNVLVLGDMNAWRREDPIRTFREAGYHELVEELSGLPQYSFLYFGARGTLDYAFASPALRGAARRAQIWHINSDWPPKMPLPQPMLRMSDHDPVVVDVDLSQAATAD